MWMDNPFPPISESNAGLADPLSLKNGVEMVHEMENSSVRVLDLVQLIPDKHFEES